MDIFVVFGIFFLFIVCFLMAFKEPKNTQNYSPEEHSKMSFVSLGDGFYHRADTRKKSVSIHYKEHEIPRMIRKRLPIEVTGDIVLHGEYIEEDTVQFVRVSTELGEIDLSKQREPNKLAENKKIKTDPKLPNL